jgi:integrase
LNISLAFSVSFRTVFADLSAENMKRIRFPITVKRGSSTVKIYRDRKPEGTYYRVTYHLGGKRHRLNFNDLQAATNEAEAKASQLSRGDVDAMQLSGKDRLEYGRAKEAVKEFALPLDAVAIEYSEARKLLDGVPLSDAAQFYARHHGRALKRKPVPDAVREMLGARKSSGVSDVYLNDLRYRLGLFADSFQCDLSSLSPDDVQSFFDSIELSPRSFNNFLSALTTFSRFAQDRGWLSREVDLLSGVKRRKEKRTPVEILSPQEMVALLTHATPQIAPCFALGAFAGLRSEEILKLEWADVTRRPGFIEVAAHKAKTAARRLVPISDNLARWLASSSRDGLVWQNTKGMFHKVRSSVAEEAQVNWKQNGLRHSWISYRLALLQDVNRVALEAGNSPQMIFRHYRELVTPQEARTWFAIVPGAAPNVVPIHASR